MTFYRPLPYPMHKKNFKKSFSLLIMISQKFHGDSVKNESARAKKKLEGGAKRPPPSLFRVNARRKNGSFLYIVQCTYTPEL